MAGSSEAIIQKSKDHLVEPWEVDHKCSGAPVSSITFLKIMDVNYFLQVPKCSLKNNSMVLSYPST
jgi:hypothetical protein